MATNSYNCHLYQQDNGYSVAELLVLGLVAEHLHGQQGTDAAAKGGKEQKRYFAHTPMIVACFVLVDAVGDEGQQVGRQEVKQDYP